MYIALYSRERVAYVNKKYITLWLVFYIPLAIWLPKHYIQIPSMYLYVVNGKNDAQIHTTWCNFIVHINSYAHKKLNLFLLLIHLMFIFVLNIIYKPFIAVIYHIFYVIKLRVGVENKYALTH